MKVKPKIKGQTDAASTAGPFFQKKALGNAAPFFKKDQQAAPHIQKEDGAGKQEDQKKKEEEEGNKALTEGIKTVGDNLMSNNPEFKKLYEPRLEALKDFAWTDRPTSYKAGVISFGLANLTIVGSVFAADPKFRSQMIDFLQDKNLAAPLQLVPYSEYFFLKEFKYKLPAMDQPAYQFDTKFSITPYWDLLRSHYSYLPQASLDFGLSGAYNPNQSSFGLTGGNFSLGMFDGGLSLTGGTFKELSPYPYIVPGTMPGEPPTTVMKSVPGMEPMKFDTPQFQFMLSVDFWKLFNKEK